MKKLLIILSIIIIASSLSANISVRFDRLYCISPGEIVELPILMENSYPSYQLGGFDFLIKYDNRLIFSQARVGDLLSSCGWEYFTYSSPSVNTIRIVALAETNNGSNHPICFADSSGTLALLRFQIATDTSNINDFLPVWWSWGDCGDNTISSQNGNELYISDSVYFFSGSIETNITQNALFPTPYGSPSECIAIGTPTPSRLIDFYSGGFDISPNGFQVTCISDIIAPNDSGSCGAVVTFEIPINSSCAGMSTVSSPPSGSFFPLGSTVVTTIASDSLGHLDTCFFTISIEDNEPPTITNCQSDTTLYTTPGNWWTQLFYNFSASDLCSGVVLESSHPTGSYFAIGATTVFCVAIDLTGNADTTSFVVTVIDNEAPILLCPDTIFLQTENAQCGATVDFTIVATDNSRQVTVIKSIESGSFLPIGVTHIGINASDPYGNSDSCSFVVIVEDNEPPQISCFSSIVVANDLGSCGAIVDYNIEASDNCGAPLINYSEPPGSFFPIGSTLVSITATDDFQNIDTCQFFIVVQDTEPPQISAPEDIVLQSDFNQCGVTVDYTYTVTDNCYGFDVTATRESGSFFEVGSTLVVLEVTDNSGLRDSASFYIMIEDNQPPIIENVSDISIMSDSGLYGAMVNYNPLVSDNCQLDSLIVYPPTGSYFEIGTHEVSVRAVDVHGNIDSITFSVLVVLQDIDNDLIADFEDNCITKSNPLQEDTNRDGVGDACCCLGNRGNINNGLENPPYDNGIDISDVVYLVAYMFGIPGGPSPACPSEADIDASGAIDISDIVTLVGYMFGGSGEIPLGCP